MADDGVFYIDGTRMYKHILFYCVDGKRIVQGFLLSSIPEPNMTRQDIMFIVDNDPIQYTINEGWWIDEDGNWKPPEEIVVDNISTLERDVKEIKQQLCLLKEYEETAKWLGFEPYSDECDEVLPLPVYHKPQMPQAPRYNNLFEAFQSLVGNDIMCIQPMVETVVTEIPPKKELLNDLKYKIKQLEECRKNGGIE